MKLTAVAIALTTSLCISGCATILNEDYQLVNVTSSTGEPITGTVNGVPFEAPGIVRLTRENENKIFITETEGCVRETVAEKKVDSKFFVNILSGGVFGSTTDYSTDEMWEYSENIVIQCKG